MHGQNHIKFEKLSFMSVPLDLYHNYMRLVLHLFFCHIYTAINATLFRCSFISLILYHGKDGIAVKI